MESFSSPRLGIPECSLDFSFGFDNPTFSDRTLQLEIADDDPHTDQQHPTPQVKKTIHINSFILAASSQFFRKLFSNGMRESEQKHVKLRLETSEEDSFMDLLKYIYSNTLPTTLHALLHLWVMAEKFEAALCSRDCTRLLDMPLTCEVASLYLDLPPSLYMSPVIVPFINAAKRFLIAHFEDFDKCKEDILDLSLAGIQFVLSHDDLQVISEDVVYDYVLKWARKHYPDLEERRGILTDHLLDLIRFQFMTTPKLIEVKTCSDIDNASDIVTRALRLKSEASQYRKHCVGTEEGNGVCRQFVERAYKYKIVKVVELESSPHEHCTVDVQFTRKELRSMGRIRSEGIHLGEQQVVLEIYKLGNFIKMGLRAVRAVARFQVVYEIAVRSNLLEEFVVCHWNNHMTFSEPEHITNIVASIFDNDHFFIDGVLHVRLQLTKI